MEIACVIDRFTEYRGKLVLLFAVPSKKDRSNLVKGGIADRCATW